LCDLLLLLLPECETLAQISSAFGRFAARACSHSRCRFGSIVTAATVATAPPPIRANAITRGRRIPHRYDVLPEMASTCCVLDGSSGALGRPQ